MTKKLAYDRSARFYDHDGRLHVEITPISKANICPYYGREIPRSEQLGLDQGKIYQLLRAPEELRFAASTSNGVPLLEIHKAVSPMQPAKHLVVGSVGTDAAFEPPYLKNSLTVWVKSAIDLIESEKKKRLSCGYHYDADMTPGTYMGVKYDGVMRHIRFNHVALVEDGRAGADVMVADELPFEFKYGDTKPMPKNHTATTSHRALVARGALAMFLKPVLAEDAKIDYKTILLGTTSDNWSDAKKVIAARLTTACKDQLAAGKSLDGLDLALDSLDSIAMDEWKDDDDDDDKDGKDEETEEEKEIREKREASDKKAADKAARDKKAADKKAADKKAADAKAAKDRKAADEKDDDDDDKDDKDDKDGNDAMDGPVPLTKEAMDEQIALAEKRVEDRMRASSRALREAEEIVRPVLGAVIAQDSAAEVYGLLFKQQGVDTKGVPKEGYKALAQMTIKAHQAGKQRKQSPQRMAHDSSAAKSFSERFPDAAKVRFA